MQTQEPTRTLAFLFTDIEGSAERWERFPESMGSSLERHDEILRGAVEAAAGKVVKTMGDGLMAVFASAHDGVRACLQRPTRPRGRTMEQNGSASRPHGSPRRRSCRELRRLSRPGGESHRSDHGRRSRRAGPALSRRGRSGRGRVARELDAPGPRGASPQESGSAGAHLPARSSGPVDRLPRTRDDPRSSSPTSGRNLGLGRARG